MSVAELRQKVSENRTTVTVAEECRAKQAVAAEQLARGEAWAGSSAGRAAGTKVGSPSAGKGRQGNQGPAEVATQGASPHVADKQEVI